MNFFTVTSENYKFQKIFVTRNKYKIILPYLFILIFTNTLFCQTVVSELIHTKLRRISLSDEQTNKSLHSNRNIDGLRIKSSSYKNAEINQSNFGGYTIRKIQKLGINKDGNFISNYDEHYTKNNTQMILTNTLSAMEYQVNGIFSLKKKDFLIIGAVSGITLGLLALDAKLDRSVTNIMDENSTIDNVTDFITEFGASKGIYTVAGFAGLSVITGSNKGLQTSLYAFEAMLNSGLWIRLGKLFAGRERPSAAYEYSHHSSGIWRGPIHQIINEEKRSVASFDAFPSGHTATIFSIATVFAEQYKDIPIIPIISYSFASLVGISRMIEHTHWASDVFLGACIGYICGKTTVEFYRQKEHYTTKKIKFAFRPLMTPQNYGADIVMNF
jgi:membrane-associated phospholipid phosphatase